MKPGARLWALSAMALSGAAMFLQFGPALMGLFEGWLPVFAGQATRWGAGLVLPLLPSAALLISARASGRRWWGIDLVHLMAVAALLGLFGWSRWV